MVNRYPWWKNLLVLSAVIFAVVYSLPNFFAPDLALQVSRESSANRLSTQDKSQVEQILRTADISIINSELEEGTLLIRLSGEANQLRAKDELQKALGGAYVVALNKAPTTPNWLRRIGARPLNLGLDLSGGVHFLLEVDTDAYIKTRMENYAQDFRIALVDARLRGSVEYVPQEGIWVRFNNAGEINQGREILEEKRGDLVIESREGNGLFFMLPQIIEREYVSYAVEQNLTILRNRVNELGVSQPLVQRQGRSRIVVELPGVQDTAQAKRILGKFANLEFRLESSGGIGRERFEFRNPRQGSGVWLSQNVIVSGENVTSARSGFDQNGQPMVSISLDSQGGRRMNQATRGNVGKRMGVLFIERRVRTKSDIDRQALRVAIGEKYEKKSVISFAVVRSALGSQFQIEGLDSVTEAVELALLLRAGSLSAPLSFVEERTVGPSLGAENIRAGVLSVVVGFLLVVLFMLFWYRGLGFAADLALIINLFLILALMSLMGAILTLPGIAGIVLTVGMAVDANVLIYSRIKEEILGGTSTQNAIAAGYQRALITILDANLTTLLVAVILYAIGTGAVRGFAVTLSVGILTSMFSSIICTRAVVNIVYGGHRGGLHIGGFTKVRPSVSGPKS